MSIQQQESQIQPTKRSQRREPGACEPCKYFKTKCDHHMPCSACRDDTQRYNPCAYSTKSLKSQTELVHTSSATDYGTEKISQRPPKDSNFVTTPTRGENSPQGFSVGLLSVPLAIDKFKYLKSTPKSFISLVASLDGPESIQPSPPSTVRSDAEAVVANLESQLNDVLELVWLGRMMEAWSALGSLSQSVFRLRRVMKQQTSQLWKHILRLKVQLGLSLGEPAAIYPQDCEVELTYSNLWNEEDWILPTLQLLYNEIQAVLMLDSMHATATERFVNVAAKILSNQTFVRVAYCVTVENSLEARDLQVLVHLVFMLLRCSFAEIAQHDLTLEYDVLSTTAHDQIFHKRRSKLSHSRLALKSSKFIANIFRQTFDATAQRLELWVKCHTTWIACTFLGIGKLRSEIDWSDACQKLEFVQQAFHQLVDMHADCHLFSTAAPRLEALNSVLPEVTTVTSNKRALSDEVPIERSTKRKRSLAQISTPGRSIMNQASSSEGVGQEQSDRSMPLSCNDDINIPITPIYGLQPYHITPTSKQQSFTTWAVKDIVSGSPRIHNIGEHPRFIKDSIEDISHDQYRVPNLSSPLFFHHMR